MAKGAYRRSFLIGLKGTQQRIVKLLINQLQFVTGCHKSFS